VAVVVILEIDALVTMVAVIQYVSEIGVHVPVLLQLPQCVVQSPRGQIRIGAAAQRKSRTTPLITGMNFFAREKSI
jgi:hypothetical protein